MGSDTERKNYQWWLACTNEGRISVKEKDKKHSKCVYAKKEKECKEKLQMLIKSYKSIA